MFFTNILCNLILTLCETLGWNVCVILLGDNTGNYLTKVNVPGTVHIV